MGCEGWIGLKASWAEIVGLRIEKGGGRIESSEFKPPRIDPT
jgi:hypothetical protein